MTAETRARIDIRRATLLLAIVASLSVGYAVGTVSGDCDPSTDGCRFVDDATVWQTVDGVAWQVCRHEDSAGPCVWDAARDGNGEGRSFTVTSDGVTYLP